MLAGNGSFVNRGCEAIALGSMEILDRTFDKNLKVIYCAHGTVDECMQDVVQLGPARWQALAFTRSAPRWSRKWGEFQANKRLGTSLPGLFGHLDKPMREAAAVICIGGDNYSLDYGLPDRFFQFDRRVIRNRRPLIYLGVSVGPFSSNRTYEKMAAAHFGRVDAILARESATVDYLRTLSITRNVHLVADPAFLMAAVPPDPTKFCFDRTGFLGVNLSSDVGDKLAQSRAIEAERGLTESDTMAASREQVYDAYAKVIDRLARESGLNIVFIPHVSGIEHSDFVFMSRIAERMEYLGMQLPYCVPDTLSAPEYKWIISRARVFIGARTHSTLASFSSGVPTISLSYSLKSSGISRDMYGSDVFCIPGSQVSVERLVDALRLLLNEESEYREKLINRAATMGQRASRAGVILAEWVR